MGRLAAIGAGLLVLMEVAHELGRFLWVMECMWVTAFASLTSAILALIAMFRHIPEGEFGVRRLIGVLLLIWLIAAIVTEQFAWAKSTHQIAVAVAWLTPLIIGGVVLPKLGEWLAGAGCWAALFAGTTALTYSASHSGSGLGLIVAWLS